jgi:hypothetical protein
VNLRGAASRVGFWRAVILACALVAAMPVSSTAAETISANERCLKRPGCTFSADLYRMWVGESPLLSMPPVLDYPHNVVASDRGRDGRPLFDSATIGAGKSTVVRGTEYLGPGTYHFICSVHEYPNIYGNRMEANLVVQDNGHPPRPRPTIEVTIPAQSLRRVLGRAALAVIATSESASENVKFIASRGGRIIASRAGFTLGPGESRTFSLRLRPWARRELPELDSARISLLGSARYGEPDVARRTLR